MLPGMGTPVFEHHVERLLGDRPHGLHVLIQPEVQHRPHVQAAHRRMGVPGAHGAVLPEDPGEALGVFRQVLQRHRAVLDEGDGLSFLLHRHHDVQPGLAHLEDLGLEAGVDGLHHPAALLRGVVPMKAELAHEISEGGEPAPVLRRVLLGEFHQQERLGLAAHEPLHHRPEHRDVHGQFDHGPVDQLHRHRLQRDDVLGGIHGIVK